MGGRNSKSNRTAPSVTSIVIVRDHLQGVGKGFVKQNSRGSQTRRIISRAASSSMMRVLT